MLSYDITGVKKGDIVRGICGKPYIVHHFNDEIVIIMTPSGMMKYYKDLDSKKSFVFGNNKYMIDED